MPAIWLQTCLILILVVRQSCLLAQEPQLATLLPYVMVSAAKLHLSCQTYDLKLLDQPLSQGSLHTHYEPYLSSISKILSSVAVRYVHPFEFNHLPN